MTVQNLEHELSELSTGVLAAKRAVSHPLIPSLSEMVNCLPVLLLLGLLTWPDHAYAGRAVLGSLTAALGQVQVDNVAGIPGTALMEGDVVATGSKSNAMIELRSGTKITIAETTEVALSYDTPPGGLELRQGAVALQTGPGQVSQVNTKSATSIVLQSENGLPALCRVSAIGSQVGVLNEKGRVEVHGAGAPFLLPPGKYVVLQAGQPQSGLIRAGQVDAAIPTEVVDRQGTVGVPLKVSDQVYWEDLVRTEKNGRVRIKLDGGSLLTIGSRSQMRIIQHSSDKEQTDLELRAGRMREQVLKLTKPDHRFKTTTQTAVIGVVGTDLIIIATPDSTTVICLEGVVSVSNINPSITGSVTLHAGQDTTVPLNGPPTAPTAATVSNLHFEISQVTISNVLTRTAVVLLITEAGLSGSSLAILGVAVSEIGNASNLLNQAGSSSTGAGLALGNFGPGIGNLPTGWIPVGCAITTFQQENSSSIPGTCP